MARARRRWWRVETRPARDGRSIVRHGFIIRKRNNEAFRAPFRVPEQLTERQRHCNAHYRYASVQGFAAGEIFELPGQ
jgi:hypothetical protein